MARVAQLRPSSALSWSGFEANNENVEFALTRSGVKVWVVSDSDLKYRLTEVRNIVFTVDEFKSVLTGPQRHERQAIAVATKILWPGTFFGNVTRDRWDILEAQVDSLTIGAVRSRIASIRNENPAYRSISESRVLQTLLHTALWDEHSMWVRTQDGPTPEYDAPETCGFCTIPGCSSGVIAITSGFVCRAGHSVGPMGANDA